MSLTPAIMSVADVADMLRVSPRTIRRMLSAGCSPVRPLPVLGLGRQRQRVRFAARDVVRYVEGQHEADARRRTRNTRGRDGLVAASDERATQASAYAGPRAPQVATPVTRGRGVV